MELLPNTVPALIAALAKDYPVRNPKPSQSLEEIMYAAGQRSVVEKLLALQNEERDTNV